MCHNGISESNISSLKLMLENIQYTQINQAISGIYMLKTVRKRAQWGPARFLFICGVIFLLYSDSRCPKVHRESACFELQLQKNRKESSAA